MRAQLIVIFTVLGALLAALWRRIVSNVRECSACRGFGIARCADWSSLRWLYACAFLMRWLWRPGVACVRGWAALGGRASSGTTSRAQCAWVGATPSASTAVDDSTVRCSTTPGGTLCRLQRACRRAIRQSGRACLRIEL